MANPTLKRGSSPLSAAQRAAEKRARRASSVAEPEPKKLTKPRESKALGEQGKPTGRQSAPVRERFTLSRPSWWPTLRREAVAEPASKRRLQATGLLALLTLLALVAAGLLGDQYLTARRTDEARTAGVAAARSAVPVVLSYDYRHLQQDFAAAGALITGGFKSQYAQTTSSVVGPTATKYHGVVTAAVAPAAIGGGPAVSVVSAAPDKVVVLVFVNQTTTSDRIKGPRVDLDRVRMTMVHTRQGWRVSAVDAL